MQKIILPFLIIGGLWAQGPQVSGSLSQSFLYSLENDYLIPGSSEGSFEISEFLINIQQQINPDLRVGLQFIARDFGDEGNLSVELDWAYADYSPSEYFGIRAGRFKLPQGLYNEIRDLDIVRDEVLLPQSVYPEEVRAIVSGVNGINLYGNLFGLEYQNYVGNMNISREVPFVKFLGDEFNSPNTSLENKYVFGTSLTYWLFSEHLRLNYNYMSFAGYFNVGGEHVILEIPERNLIAELGKVENIREAFSLDVNVNIVGIELILGDLVLAAEGKLQIFETKSSTAFAKIVADSLARQLLPSRNSIPLIYDQLYEYNYGQVFLGVRKSIREEFWGWYLKGSYRLVDEMALTFGYGETAIGEIKPNDYKDYQQDGYLGVNYNFGSNVSLKAEAHGVIGTYYAYPTSDEVKAQKYGSYYLVRGTYAF